MNNTPPNWTLGDRLVKARKVAGLRQADLVELLGVQRSTISLWEADKVVPRGPFLRVWAERCDVPLDWLLGNISGAA